jgi:hypothetical protein
MTHTAVKLRHDVARRLEMSCGPGESCSDVVTRLLDDQPAKTVEEWRESLAPLEGRSLFTEESRERL